MNGFDLIFTVCPGTWETIYAFGGHADTWEVDEGALFSPSNMKVVQTVSVHTTMAVNLNRDKIQRDMLRHAADGSGGFGDGPRGRRS
jgi:hypothetical protein